MQTLDLRLERWQTAIDQSRVDSIGIGLLSPVSAVSDMEFRFAYDRSEDYGRTIAFSVFCYFYGG